MDPLNSLTDARNNALSWRTVAERLAQLESSAPLAPGGQPWIRAVEAASGYSANHLRRMSKASSLIETMQLRWPDYARTLSSLSFTHAEILGRLWQADPGQVERLLTAERWPTYAQLLARYEATRSRRSVPKAAGKLALASFRAHVRSALRAEFGLALLDRIPYHPYAKPDFLVLQPNSQVMAWDCLLLPEKIDEEALRRRFVAWATEATFVEQFWVAVQDDHGREHMQRCIEDLDLANVGVMALGDMTPIIHPHGPPDPDRRNAAGVTTFALSLPPETLER